MEAPGRGVDFKRKLADPFSERGKMEGRHMERQEEQGAHSCWLPSSWRRNQGEVRKLEVRGCGPLEVVCCSGRGSGWVDRPVRGVESRLSSK